MWPTRRIVGESLLGVWLALLAAGIEALQGQSLVRIVAVALAAGALTLLRRVLPAAVLLVVAVGSAGLVGLAPLFPLVAWSAGRRVSQVAKALGTFTAAYVLSLGLSFLEVGFSLSGLLITAPLLLVVLVVPGLAGRYWSQRRTLLDTLRAYNAHLLRERAMIAGQARLRERQRIAQDMHDSLGHQLALISVHTGALEVDRELTGRQREAVGVLREASVAAMHELREVVGLLRDGTHAPDHGDSAPGPGSPGVAAVGAGDTTSPSRGVAGIEGLVAASRNAGTDVELRRSGEPRPLPPAADHAAYRISQEGLTNAHKHAPGASITIELRYEPDSLVVEVANGPVPATAADRARKAVSGGQGLTGLGERTRLIGGMVHAGPTADGGFRLAGVLPYTSPEGGAPGPSPQDPFAAPTGDTFGAPAGSTFAAPAENPFVVPTDDFRRQISAGSPGESDPVIYRDGLPKELANAMSSNNRSSGIAIGCGVAAGLGLLVVAALVVGGILLVGETNKALIEPKVYDSVTVGQSEAEVRNQLPEGDSFLTDGLDKGAPPVPAGAKCLSLNSTEVGSSLDKSPVFRFCFKDGKLIEKKSFEVKQ
ncbi:sensor histidine kinase [Streptomyces sp. NPDC001339]|uniref:sensor histidine kinase n=1 Tax=Streptomyces sp. NPDC001339 TaxID=3364563 RepID=UPI00368EB75D